MTIIIGHWPFYSSHPSISNKSHSSDTRRPNLCNGFPIHFQWQQTTEENTINYCELLGQKKYATFRSSFFAVALIHMPSHVWLGPFSGACAVMLKRYIRLRFISMRQKRKYQLSRETRKSKSSKQILNCVDKESRIEMETGKYMCVIHILHVHNNGHAMAPV